MSMSLKIPDSYKNTITVAVKGIGNNSDAVICTTDKKLLIFHKGCLIKKCHVEIEAKYLEPFIVYEPKIVVYYILHGDNKVVIVKDGESLEMITTYANVYEMTVNDHNNSGTPQLYLRTDKGFECIDIVENKEQSTSQTYHEKIQETSVVYTFCIQKLQQLQILYDTEKNKLSQKSTSFLNAMMQVSNNNTSDIKLSLNIVTKNAWLKLSNKNLVYGFTLQNTSKLPISNFNLILLKENKEIWSKFCVRCWAIKKTENAFNFHSDFENNSLSNNIEKSCFKLNSDSSIIVASIIDNWNCKSLPYSVNCAVYIDNENFDRIQYVITDEIMVTTNFFLDKEFDTFVKNSVYIEDLVVVNCTKLLSRYQIKCTICLHDLKTILVNEFKFGTKHEWFVLSSLSWLRTIVCCLDPISPSEYILEVFSDSLVSTKTFIQVFSTMLPEHSCINGLDNKVSTYLNINAIIQDLRELRKVFKEYLDEQIIIPRERWNNIRSNLTFT